MNPLLLHCQILRRLPFRHHQHLIPLTRLPFASFFALFGLSYHYQSSSFWKAALSLLQTHSGVYCWIKSATICRETQSHWFPSWSLTQSRCLPHLTTRSCSDWLLSQLAGNFDLNSWTNVLMQILFNHRKIQEIIVVILLENVDVDETMLQIIWGTYFLFKVQTNIYWCEI